MRISEHISYRESVFSQTSIRKGIDNTPGQKELENMKIVAEAIFEPLRTYFNVPIGISSFYRSKDLNTAIGGSKTSQHVKGQAMDIDAHIYGGITNKEIFDFIKDNLVFDQLLHEFGTDEEPAWVHVSFNPTGNQRKQILRAYSLNGRTAYRNYD